MHKWIAGSTCAAAVLSLAVASAQTNPQTSDDQTKSAPSTRSGSSNTSSQTTGTDRRNDQSSRTSTSSAPQRVTMTGCMMQGTDARNGAWQLSHAMPAAPGSTASAGTSRSGSPSNEGTTGAGNRNGTTSGVSGSTSTGTSGARTGTTSDTEASGGGIIGSTDQRGSTVGSGATSAATGNTSAGGQSSSAPAGGSTYELVGVQNPTQYRNKRVEVIGTMNQTRNSGNQTLRVTSVRALEGSCQ